jgi:CHAD domain-containing protein
MVAGGVLQLDPERRADLLHEWRELFERFEQAREKCRRSWKEKNVHQLRLSARHSLPVIELLRAIRPQDALWSLTYHALRDLLKVLGPLRDAQVRRLRLEGMEPRDRAINFLIARSEREEARARPSARTAVKLFKELPMDVLKGEQGDQLLPPDTGKAIRAVLDHRRRRLWQRWAATRQQLPTTLHKARVALKRYRYLLEALGPCLTATQRRSLPRFKHVQDTIGRWHDDQLFIDWLKRAGRSGATVIARMSEAERSHRERMVDFLREQGRSPARLFAA